MQTLSTNECHDSMHGTVPKRTLLEISPESFPCCKYPRAVIPNEEHFEEACGVKGKEISHHLNWGKLNHPFCENQYYHD